MARPPIRMGVATIKRRLEALDSPFYGRSQDGRNCPVALLLKQAGAHEPFVWFGDIGYVVAGKHVHYEPGLDVQKLIKSVDSLGRHVPVPRQYVIDVCEGILAGEI